MNENKLLANGKITDLYHFYENRSSRNSEGIEYINSAGQRKAFVTNKLIIRSGTKTDSLLDYGCTYGSFCNEGKKLVGIKKVLGLDSIFEAIKVDKSSLILSGLEFHTINRLETRVLRDYIRGIANCRFGCISLIDVLEHVHNCRDLVRALSDSCETFLN